MIVASSFDEEGVDLLADVNGEGMVNIMDLVFVTGWFGNVPASLSADSQVPDTLQLPTYRSGSPCTDTDSPVADLSESVQPRNVGSVPVNGDAGGRVDNL